MKELHETFLKHVRYQMGNSLTYKNIVSPKSDYGQVKSSLQYGLRPFQQQAEIQRAFRANGFRVFIVSAAAKHVAEVPSTVDLLEPSSDEYNYFGYGFEKSEVYGLMMAVNNVTNKIESRLQEGYPVTAEAGKVEAIHRLFKEQFNKTDDDEFIPLRLSEVTQMETSICFSLLILLI